MLIVLLENCTACSSFCWRVPCPAARMWLLRTRVPCLLRAPPPPLPLCLFLLLSLFSFSSMNIYMYIHPTCTYTRALVQQKHEMARTTKASRLKVKPGEIDSMMGHRDSWRVAVCCGAAAYWQTTNAKMTACDLFGHEFLEDRTQYLRISSTIQKFQSEVLWDCLYFLRIY